MAKAVSDPSLRNIGFGGLKRVSKEAKELYFSPNTKNDSKPPNTHTSCENLNRSVPPSTGSLYARSLIRRTRTSPLPASSDTHTKHRTVAFLS